MARRKLAKTMKTQCRTVAGRMLREYRIRLGLPAVILAERANLTAERICRIERGNHAAEAMQLSALLAQIEATPGEIDRLLREHKQRKHEYSGRTVRDAFEAINEIETRLSNLEIELGVTSDDQD